ncbi:hypothetical protein TNCV_2609581 [Trichonephila clavipes]|nr:hypothetical protein TNCV_2609581 [Trichonephila clavipes]
MRPLEVAGKIGWTMADFNAMMVVVNLGPTADWENGLDQAEMKLTGDVWSLASNLAPVCVLMIIKYMLED